MEQDTTPTNSSPRKNKHDPNPTPYYITIPIPLHTNIGLFTTRQKKLNKNRHHLLDIFPPFKHSLTIVVAKKIIKASFSSSSCHRPLLPPSLLLAQSFYFIALCDIASFVSVRFNRGLVMVRKESHAHDNGRNNNK